MDGGLAAVSSRFVGTSVTSTGAGVSSGYWPVNPGQNGAGDPGFTVIKNYSEYRFKHAKIHYTPQVGTTTTGVVYLAYFDNPEIIFKAQTYAHATLLSLCQSAVYSVSAPVWQALELPAQMRYRRKVYAVDSTQPASSTEADMVAHGVWLYAVIGAPVSTTLGVLSIDYAAEAMSLQLQSASGI
jgi:hypothetical protein